MDLRLTNGKFVTLDEIKINPTKTCLGSQILFGQKLLFHYVIQPVNMLSQI
jgi:hypothetical protein